MLRISITDLKNSLSKYLRLVQQGEVVEITHRDVPIARLEAIGAGSTTDDSFRQKLIREGVISPARAKPDRAFLETPPVPCEGDAVRALIEERGDR